MNIYFNSRLNWFAVDSPDLENYLYVFLKDGRRNNSDISKLDAGFRKEDWQTCSVVPEITSFGGGSVQWVIPTESKKEYIPNFSIKWEDETPQTTENQTEALREKLDQGEKSGFVDGDLWDKDASEDTPPQSSQLSDYVKKELQQQSDNLNKVISSHLQKEEEEEEFTVLSYEYDGFTYYLQNIGQIGADKFSRYSSPLMGYNDYHDDTPPADFKDRTILSVRRNSDGIVFSVGDRVMAKSYIIPVDKTAIVEFKIDRLGIIDDSIGVFGGYFSLSNCEHPPQEQGAVRTFNSPEDAEIIAELENRLDDLDLKLEKQNRLLNNILNLITGYFDGE